MAETIKKTEVPKKSTTKTAGKKVPVKIPTTTPKKTAVKKTSSLSSMPKISYKFYNVPEDQQNSIKTIIEKNIAVKIDAYLEKIYAQNKDAEVRIDYKVQQNKKKKYEASFIFSYDGKQFVYKNKVAFRFTDDLVNHAFARFKEYLSSNEGGK